MTGRARERIQPYLSKELAQRLARYSVQHNLTESAVVERALTKHLDGLGDFDVLQTRLKNINRSLGRIERLLDYLLETKGLFLETWLAYLPDLPASQAAQHAARGAKRLERFILELQKRVTRSGRTFKPVLGEDQEAAAGKQPEGSAETGGIDL